MWYRLAGCSTSAWSESADFDVCVYWCTPHVEYTRKSVGSVRCVYGTAAVFFAELVVFYITRNRHMPQNTVFTVNDLALIQISEPTIPYQISYAVYCLKKKTKTTPTTSQNRFIAPHQITYEPNPNLPIPNRLLHLRQ